MSSSRRRLGGQDRGTVTPKSAQAKPIRCVPAVGLAIADLWETRQHADHLRERGWQHVQRRGVGWRMWYGGPWVSTRLVTATKPA